MDQSDHIEEGPARALRMAIEVAGSQMALARPLGVTQSAISKWAQSGRGLPPEHVLAVEAATGISRHQLRPDIYPPFEVPAGRTVGTGAPIVSCDRGAETKRRARA